jgi:hypothetical protein
MRDGVFKSGETKSQVATGGVSGDTEPFEIKSGEGVILVSVQCAVSAADILKCARPSAAWIADATVFDVPCGNAGFFQRVTKMSGISEIVLGAPIAAVNEKDTGMRAYARGKANVNELIGVRAVRETQIRLWWFLLENGFALHREQYKTARGSTVLRWKMSRPDDLLESVRDRGVYFGREPVSELWDVDDADEELELDPDELLPGLTEELDGAELEPEADE